MTPPQSDPEREHWLRRGLPDSGASLAWMTGIFWLASFLMCYALLATPVLEGKHGLMNITESFGALERVALWQRALSWFPGGHADGSFVTWPRALISWTFRACLLAMFVLQWLAFRTAWRSARFSLWNWLLAPIGAQVIMMLMVPSNADIFYYAMSGDMANQGINPYLTELYKVPENPFYPYNHWVEITTVYGPLWTLINQAIIGITGEDPTHAIIGYKIFFAIVAIALAVAVWAAARLLGVRSQWAIAAAVLVAWQPNMMTESSGQGHNDPLTMLLVLGGITLTILGAGRATTGGIILTTLSTLVKYVSLPMLAIVSLTRLGNRGERADLRRIAAGIALDITVFGAVLLSVFGPYWNGFRTVQEMVTEPGRIYTNPIWFGPFILMRQVNPEFAGDFRDVTRPILQATAIVLVCLVITRFGWWMWKEYPTQSSTQGQLPGWTRPTLVAFTAIFGILAFVPVNTHPWYWIWPVVPIAVLIAWDGEHHRREPTSHRWLVPYLVLTAVLTMIYHTRIVMP